MKPLNKSHLKSIVELSDITLGKNFLSTSYFKQYVNSAKHIGLILEKEKEIIGFSLIDILTPEELKKTVLTNSSWFYDITKAYTKIALRKQTVIHPKYKNLGYGTQLVNLASTFITTELEISTAWKHPNNVGMIKILLKNGFKLKKSIPNYWQTDSINKKYHCIICGMPPCQCSAEIYIKKKH
ncbi:MAG: GNAT family N-acetyltransferase [Vicingaceae bacterium]